MHGISITLMRYFGVQFLVSVTMVSMIVAGLVFLVDSIEMLRHYASKDKIDSLSAIGLSVLKLPSLVEKVLPFIFLFAAMWTFSKLTRSNELVVARASGVSAWQFLAPALAIAFILGLMNVFVFNPASATMLARYKIIEKSALHGEHSTMKIGRTGLWLREAVNGNHRVVHALDVDDRRDANPDQPFGSGEGDLRLLDVIIIQYEGQGRFESRIDAESAVLKGGAWHLANAWVSRAGQDAVFMETSDLKTTLSPRRIQESFAMPETLNIWELSEFIGTANAAGFSVHRHRFHWHALASKPFLFASMVFLAATFSLRISRMGGVVRLIMAGVLAGFGLFFISDVTGALGQSGLLPPTLAAYAPTAITALLGMTMVFHMEDG